MDTLYDDESGLFHSSQDAWEDFYRLPWKDRDAAERPTVDKTAYTGWNACAASAFIKAGAVLGAPRHLKTAARTLEVLWSDLWEGELGFQHTAGGSPNQPRMLDDHVAFLRASLELFQADSDPIHLERAVQVAAVIDRLFGPAEGGYLDVAAAGAPSAEAPLAGDRPVLENSLLAEALAVLACLTGDAAYQERATLALSAFETIVPDSSFLGDSRRAGLRKTKRRCFSRPVRLGPAPGKCWRRGRYTSWLLALPESDRSKPDGRRSEDIPAAPGAPEAGPGDRPGADRVSRLSTGGGTRALRLHERHVPGAHSFGAGGGAIIG